MFVTSTTNLRTFIGNSQWGRDLNGVNVTNKGEFQAAIGDLRSPNGRNTTYNWRNPVKWSLVFKNINTTSRAIYGSDENTINTLINMKINTLVVEHMGCGSSSTILSFDSMDPTAPSYWAERWELYKHSYAMAVWARNKGIKMIEFYNEPDLSLGACLDFERYIDYYTIRSLSIQNAYEDINNSDPANSVQVSVLASAFARITYGGNTTRYLGDVSVQLRNNLFGQTGKNISWTNMHMYSYHTYGKTGSEIFNDFNTIQASINADSSFANEIPAIITEHNAHTSSDWDTLTTTPDDPKEASRLVSQIMNLVLAKMHSHYVFKFSITPSFSASREIAKNGIHWGEIYSSPFNLLDTTLSAEGFRLVTKMKQSKIYEIKSNDTSKYRSYIGSKNEEEGVFYFYVINDKNDFVTLSVDLSSWNIEARTKLICERVGEGFMGEVSEIMEASNRDLSLTLPPYSLARLSIPEKAQVSSVSYSILSCTARAGNQSSQGDCSSLSIFIGTSNTVQHENTCVGLIKFPVNKNVSKFQRSILKVNVEEVIGNSETTVMVLGFKNKNLDWNNNLASWEMLSSKTAGINILTPLYSGQSINGSSGTFINWLSDSNITIVGHISAAKTLKNQIRMIDVTDYVKQVISLNMPSITFLLYRPYRHPSYKTGAGTIPADDLSNGALMKISSEKSGIGPELIHFWSSPELIKNSFQNLLFMNKLFILTCCILSFIF